MRLPHAIRTVIVLVLVTWMPWCLCRWVPQGCGIAIVGGSESKEVTDRPSCCIAACCQAERVDAESDNDQAPETSEKKPCSGCPSACCAPKLSLVSPLPTVPLDTVGIDLPPTSVLAAHEAWLMTAAMASVEPTGPPRTPPGEGPGYGSGRLHLLQSSILRT
ncbi:MAG: hypothetical protein JNL80_14110 [Phycisphaerae bacterium]|jgi:hypothetical protein|nr:hypothetical protein [Phycisphaerae bacterium]